MSNIVKYKNGNYLVLLDTDTGTKIRYNDEDELIPEFPESIDICISKCCNKQCPMCHERCSPEGKHADIMHSKFIENLHPYTEIALNGNEPFHPDLIPFLEKCKSLKHVPSLTVHQDTFMNNADLLKKLCDKKLIYGLGVSLDDISDINACNDFVWKLKEFPNAVIHVINGMVKVDDLWFLASMGFKILILGYKKFGRGIGFYGDCNHEIEYYKKKLYDALPEIIDEKWFTTISFDNLAIEQLDVKRLMTEDEWNKFYMGDDGAHTFYVDLVNNKFAKSSTSTKRYDLIDDVNTMFNVIRNGG